MCLRRKPGDHQKPVAQFDGLTSYVSSAGLDGSETPPSPSKPGGGWGSNWGPVQGWSYGVKQPLLGLFKNTQQKNSIMKLHRVKITY